MKLLKYLSRLSGEHMLSNREMNELMDTYTAIIKKITEISKKEWKLVS